MNISLDYNIYHEHKLFFDEMARAMQASGHKVGLINGMRVKEYNINTGKVIDNIERIDREIGFKPDFNYLWGENETISNGNLWKCKKMDDEDVYVHFDADATELKRYTNRWILKVLDSAQPKKF